MFHAPSFGEIAVLLALLSMGIITIVLIAWFILWARRQK